MADLLCTVDDVAARLGMTSPPEPGSTDYLRTDAACKYVSAVLRARFPLIPGSPVPDPVNTVATEVTVRYLGADPASGGMVSETIGQYSYRRASGMGSTALTDDEMTVMRPYGVGPVASVVLSRGPSSSGTCPDCGRGYGEPECTGRGHAPAAPLAVGGP